MALRKCIRGGALVVPSFLALLTSFVVPGQAFAQDNSGLATQVLLTQSDLPSSYVQSDTFNSPLPAACIGSNSLSNDISVSRAPVSTIRRHTSW